MIECMMHPPAGTAAAGCARGRLGRSSKPAGSPRARGSPRWRRGARRCRSSRTMLAAAHAHVPPSPGPPGAAASTRDLTVCTRKYITFLQQPKEAADGHCHSCTAALAIVQAPDCKFKRSMMWSAICVRSLHMHGEAQAQAVLPRQAGAPVRPCSGWPAG